MDYKKLTMLMKKQKISHERLAQLLGIDKDVLDKKLSGEAEFTLWEIRCISKIFSLKRSQIMHIFFNEKFPKGNKLPDRMVNDEECGC